MRKASLILVLLAGVAQAQPVRYDGHRAVRVQVRNMSDLRTALALTDDIWSHRVGIGGPIDMRVSPEQFAALAISGVSYTVLIQDIQARIELEAAQIARARQRAGPDGPNWFEIYRDFDEVKAFAQQIAATHPALVTYQVIGQSLEGRDIFALKITGPGGPAARSQLFFNGGQHSREWVSVSTVMYIADALLSRYSTDPRVKDLVDNLEFVIVPVVNPDGYVWSWTFDRLWRKNRRDNGAGGGICIGVDTNRNWGHQWGGVGSGAAACEETYRGPSPFSEPETQVIRDFCSASPRLKAAIDFHSYSQLVMSPWGYTSAVPLEPDASYFNLLTSSIRDAIRLSGGAIYRSGPVYATIYPASGIAVDWWYGDRGIYGLTIELRDTGNEGFELPPSQIIPTGEENFVGIAALADYFMPVRFWLAAPVPIPLTPETPTTLQVGIAPGSGWTITPGSETIYYRTGPTGPFFGMPMSPTAGSIYSATLPGVSCGDTVDFYIQASAAGGPTLRYPSGHDTLRATAYEQAVVFADDMEIDGGWVATAGPGLTAGFWERADPVAAFNLNNEMANPEDDASPPPGVACFATQNGAVGGAAGLSDVDGGPAVLTSPAFDLSGATSAVFSYSQWVYSANGGPDPLIVEVSGDGSTWVEVDRVALTNGWKPATFALPPSVPTTSNVRIRFSITDEPNNSLTEAAIDDFIVRRLFCTTCYANCDGSSTPPILTPNDFQCFLDAYAAGVSAANCDASTSSPILTANDFQCFLDAYAAGCP